MDPCKSMGPNEIHPRILKELADAIAKLLSMIFEWSWESRDILTDWKLANIVPVFKEILLDKMSRTQLDKHIMLWRSNWLMGRAQRIIVNGVTSDW
ncbi:hypothetical protein WISP_106515 [Willisornis vidua]|uniref:Uncharacterized protein n=1 Tax=Willisornis vidua TaxID=1566151 RepID=A0ABQ9D2W8_9PASS|nr:hypothetical protein WISP_106515 [Willisornis vidua]